MGDDRRPSRFAEGAGADAGAAVAGDRPPSGPLPQAGEGVRAAIVLAAQVLARVGETPRLDAELLMAHALGVSREAMLLGRLDDPAPAAFDALVRRRMAHEPVAYIVGRRAFWTIELAVGPGVLVPRADSETLIEAAVDHFGRAGPSRVLDLGTGSGALLLAALAEWPDATGLGIDASADALAIAARNAERLGMAARARFAPGGWADGEGAYPLILCNPPYIGTRTRLPREVAEHEPASALFAGADGLDDYRAIAPALRPRLAPGGIVCIEIGHDQAAAVTRLFAGQGFETAVRRDLGARDRCVIVYG